MSNKADNTVVFAPFLQAAKRRLEERKKRQTVQYTLDKDPDTVITLHGLTEEEVEDCNQFSDSNAEQDKYMLYMASPTLQAVAKELVEMGQIKQEYKITEMFTPAERGTMAREVLRMSGFIGDAADGIKKVEPTSEVDEVKN